MDTVRPDFVRQLTFVDILEPQLSEEAGLVGQGEHSGNAVFHRLGETGLYESAAATPALTVSDYRQRTYLSRVIPADMQRTDSSYGFTVLIPDRKIP